METDVKLTKLASCAGCGAKVGAGTLVKMLEGFRTHTDPRLIVGYDKSAPEYRRRLLMLGATPGTSFEVVRVAPLGDPVEIRVRGSFISVRKDEAAIMQVNAQ